MELLDLFETPTNTKHRFLETTPQMTQEGYVKLAACYENGKKRMENLYKQEVTGEEQINTSGRRATEVKVYTYEEIQKIFKENQKQFKENQKIIKTSQLQLLNQPSASTSTIQEIPKRTRTRATEVETNRLQLLVEQIGTPTANDIEAAAKDLNWTNKKVRSYVDYRRKLRKGKNKI